LTDLTDLSDLTDLIDLADLTDLIDLADLTDLIDLADLSDLVASLFNFSSFILFNFNSSKIKSIGFVIE
jgi:hypothetical protein